MKSLSNTEAELKKGVAYKKSVYRKRDKQINNQQEIHNQDHNVDHTIIFSTSTVLSINYSEFFTKIK